MVTRKVIARPLFVHDAERQPMLDEARQMEVLRGDRHTPSEQPRPAWKSTYFVQACPTCGRTLMIRIEHLGRQVGCRHCHRRFTAYDPEGIRPPNAEAAADLLARANALLAKCELQSVHG